MPVSRHRPRNSPARDTGSLTQNLGVLTSIVLVTAATIAVRWWLDPILGDELAFVTLYAATMFAVWVAGAVPAVLVAVAGFVACNYLFVDPRGAFSIASAGAWVGLLAYAATNAAVIGFGAALHIARRKSGEQAEVLHTTLASIGDAVITTDVTGRVTFLNHRAETLTGWPADEARGRPLAEVFAIVNETTRAPSKNPVDKVLESGEVVGLDNHTLLIARDGRELPIDDSAAPIRIGRGETTGVVLVFRDVSDWRAAQRIQPLLANIVESSEDAIVSKSLDGIVTSWNDAAERIFGYAAAEMVGQPINRIIPPELQHEETAILERLRKGERIAPFETVRLAKSGQRLHISLTISPLRDSDGNIFGASKVARDITERKRAEAELRESERRYRSMAAELRESEERFRLLADNMSQFAWIADAKGWIFWYNQRWYEYTGTTLAEMEGWGWRKVHHPDHVDRVVEKVQRHWDSGEVWEDTFPLRSKEGEYRWFLSRAIPIRDAQGSVVRWFGTNTDVTQQRAAEEALKEADRRKNEFLATLAHELRNPLAPIANIIEILKRRGHDADARRVATATIERQLQHMVRLVEDLLDVDRITRGRIVLRQERIDLAAIMRETIESSAALFDEADQEMTIDLPDGPIFLDADPVRLAQVFGNLLSNASKYTQSGGRIAVTASADADSVTIRVADNGIGIAPDCLPRVFELFTQVDESPERAHSGLGIGLTLVRQIVDMHGGTVEARSEGHGKGSEFIVRLPRLAGADEPARQSPRETPAAGPRRILVVDDNEDAAASLASLLELAGHEVHTANDGIAAVTVAARVRPDVMLLDIGLPHRNGYEVCRQIRGETWGGDIFIIAVTGWGQEEDRRQSEQAGIDHHLVKPISFAALNALLESRQEARSDAGPPEQAAGR